MKALLIRAALATSLFAAIAVCSAQTSNTISAKFLAAPGANSTFSVGLVNSGPATSVAGFAFKLMYDPQQVSIVGVSDNSSEGSAGLQYGLGPETATGSAALPAQRIISATTINALTNATNLVEIKFQKQPGFTAPLKFAVEDRLSSPVVDGLQGANLKNIPHVFDVSQVTQ